MSEKQDRVLRALETAGISYTLTEHPAVHTIEEMDVLPLPYPEAVLKNLFLQDAGEERFFLVSLPKDRRADWKALRTYAGSRDIFPPHGFIKTERQHLNLEITPCQHCRHFTAQHIGIASCDYQILSPAI